MVIELVANHYPSVHGFYPCPEYIYAVDVYLHLLGFLFRLFFKRDFALVLLALPPTASHTRYIQLPF